MKKYLILNLILCLSSCYTFKGISIDPSDETFFVNIIETQANNAPPNLGIEFTERLKDKIRTETRLTLNDENPHIEFSGKITSFRVELLAPQPGEVAAQNRLVVDYSITMKNNRDETKGWTGPKSFSFFAEFPNSTDLLTVQETLLKDINDQVLENIFNAAFNTW